jgi:hypothetical protein
MRMKKKLASLNKQIGGDHYKKLGIEPWEIVDANGLDYYKGNVIKYVLRNKDGVNDLKKAIHYLEHIIELTEQKNERIDNNNK